MNKKSLCSPVIISITGTKGKTTVARLLEAAYLKINKETLLVDTHGHYLNGKKLGTFEESLDLHGLGPTVCPGKFLYCLKGKKNALAILETSVGSSAMPGLGYMKHDIGILTNVFEDHIGRRIKTKEDLAVEKGRIFRRVKNDGLLIFNADEKSSTERVTRTKKFLKKKNIDILPVGIDFSAFNIKKHIKNGGMAITRKGDLVIAVCAKKEIPLINLTKSGWTFAGKYQPSVYNIMLAVACVYKEQGNKLPEEAREALQSYSPDEENNARLLCYKNKNISVIIDYAHEKKSLRAIGHLASLITKRKTIGIIRFAPNRVDNQIKDYARAVANVFDVTIIYDKVDGSGKKMPKDKREISYRAVGEVSKMAFDEMRRFSKKKDNIHKTLKEKTALKKARVLAESGDVIIHIFGNDSSESIKMIKEIMEVSACSCQNIEKSSIGKRSQIQQKNNKI